MRDLLKIIVPEKTEAIVFGIFGLLLLIVLNIQRILLLAGGVSVQEVKNALSLDVTISNSLTGFEANIDPRFVDIGVWMLVGLGTFLAISFFIGWWHSVRQEVSVVEYYKHPKSYHAGHDVLVFLSRGALRLFGAVCFVIWIFVFFENVTAELSTLFMGALTNMSDPVSWLWLVLTPLLCGIGLYLFAIFMRMIVLRSRVFG